MKKFLVFCLTFSLISSAENKETKEKQEIIKKTKEKKNMIANAVPLYIKVKNNDGKDEFIKIDEKITVHHEHTYELGDKATIISFISVGAMVLIIFPIALALTIKKIVSS